MHTSYAWEGHAGATPHSPSIWAKCARTRGLSSTTLPGISVVAVTKVTCGSPQVARAMLAGGAQGARRVAARERRAPQERRSDGAHLAAAVAGPGAGRRDRAAHGRLAAERARDGGGPRERRRRCRPAALHHRHGRPRGPARGHAAAGPAGVPRAGQRDGRHRRSPASASTSPATARSCPTRTTWRAWPSWQRAAASSSAVRCSSRAATPAPSAWSSPGACRAPSTRCASARPSCSAWTR